MDAIQDAFLHADFETALSQAREFLVDPIDPSSGQWVTQASQATEDTLVRLICIIVQCIRKMDDDHLLLTVLSELLHMARIKVSTFNLITSSALQLAQMKHYTEAQVLLESYLWPSLRVNNITSTEEDSSRVPPSHRADTSDSPTHGSTRNIDRQSSFSDHDDDIDGLKEVESASTTGLEGPGKGSGTTSPPDSRGRATSQVERFKQGVGRERRLSRAVPELPSVASTLQVRQGLGSEEVEIGLELYIFHVMLPMSWAPEPTPAQARRYRRSVDALCAWLTHPSVTHLAPAVCHRYSQLLRECESSRNILQRQDHQAMPASRDENENGHGRGGHDVIDIIDPCQWHDEEGSINSTGVALDRPGRSAPTVPSQQQNTLTRWWQEYVTPYSRAWTGKGNHDDNDNDDDDGDDDDIERSAYGPLITRQTVTITAASVVTLAVAVSAVRHRADLRKMGSQAMKGLVALFSMAVTYDDTRARVSAHEVVQGINT
eukprot:TRINITY_DN2118_c1_g1_i1.p1 TRINITY_DN2118_c1_g1~~TRINITY_DN2118_c1_g1_i1.p1  ORF type:complete len:489 (-),score=88.42 TRINITY_DN2118_c1_g1_i1:25-1491(-)